MTIKPINNKLQIKVDEPKVGELDLSSKPSAVEVGTIIGLSFNAEINNIYKIGDKIFFKAWAIDIIDYNGEKFYFIDENSEGICAIIKE